MTVILNILWVVLAGFWLAVGYVLAAIVMFILIAIAFIGYERRVHRVHIRASVTPEIKISPSPRKAEYEH